MFLSFSEVELEANAFGIVKPGAKMEDLVNHCVENCSSFTKKDVVKLICGLNAMYQNEVKNTVNCLKKQSVVCTS